MSNIIINPYSVVAPVASFTDGRSIIFDGTNDGVTGHGAGGGMDGNTGSISCWFKLNTISSSRHLFMINIDNEKGNNFIRVFYHASKNWLYFNHKGSGTQVTATTSTTVENNGWHHLAYTWNVTGDALVGYIDGSSVFSTNPGLVEFNEEDGAINTVHIGTFDGSTSAWYGWINDFAIYSDVLTSGEVSTIYNSGSPNDLTGLGSAGALIAYWKMENSTDDDSGEGNAITLVNGAAFDSDTP